MDLSFKAYNWSKLPFLQSFIGKMANLSSKTCSKTNQFDMSTWTRGLYAMPVKTNLELKLINFHRGKKIGLIFKESLLEETG